MQEFQADILVATSMNTCTQVLASKLDKSFVNYFPAGPIDPLFTALYPRSNRRAFLPNPLSYVPQAGEVVTSQFLVRNLMLMTDLVSYGPSMGLDIGVAMRPDLQPSCLSVTACTVMLLEFRASVQCCKCCFLWQTQPRIMRLVSYACPSVFWGGPMSPCCMHSQGPMSC